MHLNITARHLDLTPALTDYVHRKLEKAPRYFDSIVWAQTILTVEKHRHIAELVVHTPGSTFRVKEEAGDLYSAIDLAAHKLDLHLSRAKDKQINHRKNGARQNRISPFPDSGGTSPAFLRTVTEVTKVVLEPRSLARAIKDLNSNRMPFVLFINERTNQINAVYKKGKDGYGLLEAEV
jgi:putative sigma-54 modulation protein